MNTDPDVSLKDAVEALFAAPVRTIATLDLLTTVRKRLADGTLRVAEPINSSESGNRGWQVVPWVKKAMLLMSALGQLARQTGSNGSGGANGIELDTTPWLQAPPPHCRMPAGSFIREGAHIGEGVVCAPPTVLQLGCHIGQGTILDSMVTIGVGAQVGAGAQLSCGSIVGGYILPLERLPTIVEDRVLMGSNSAVYDGAQIGEGAILLAGTQIIPSLGIYDVRSEAMVPLTGGVLRVPDGTIIGMGSRPIGSAGAQLQTAILLGKRHGPNPKDWELYVDVPLTVG